MNEEKLNEKRFVTFTKTLLKEIRSIVKENQSIKKLLILFLIKSGATYKEIGGILGVTSTTVRKMLSFKKIKKFKGV